MTPQRTAHRNAKAQGRERIALVGAGHRGSGMWGKQLLSGWDDHVEMVAICDVNPLRAENARRAIGTYAPVFTDVQSMLAAIRPDTVLVCTRDDTHDEVIVHALEAGCRVICEKPMTTTVEKCRRILEAQARTGGKVEVTFNYRFAPVFAQIRDLVAKGRIGTVTSVDFHWYLDTRHGADYFRRWHAEQANSGSLFVHKSTHHFDLLNWFLGSAPTEVSAYGSLRRYGRNGPFRGTRCKTCPHTGECNFFMDLSANERLENLFEAPSAVDGYFRDACVFRQNIDIADTMTAMLRYQNGAIVSYSLNTYMPIEGCHIALNGTEGRIELRKHERQPFEVGEGDTILVMPNFRPMESIHVPKHAGGHYGGDNRLRDMLFGPFSEDRLQQRANAMDGARSMLIGVAATDSQRLNRPVPIDLSSLSFPALQ